MPHDPDGGGTPGGPSRRVPGRPGRIAPNGTHTADRAVTVSAPVPVEEERSWPSRPGRPISSVAPAWRPRSPGRPPPGRPRCGPRSARRAARRPGVAVRGRPRLRRRAPRAPAPAGPAPPRGRAAAARDLRARVRDRPDERDGRPARGAADAGHPAARRVLPVRRGAAAALRGDVGGAGDAGLRRGAPGHRLPAGLVGRLHPARGHLDPRLRCRRRRRVPGGRRGRGLPVALRRRRRRHRRRVLRARRRHRAAPVGRARHRRGLGDVRGLPRVDGPRRHGGAGPARAAADVPADAGHRAPLARRAPRVRPRPGAGVRPLPPPRGVLALDAPARPAAGRRRGGAGAGPARADRRLGSAGPRHHRRGRPGAHRDPPAGAAAARRARAGAGARPRPLDPASGPVRVLDMPPGPAPVVRAGSGARRPRADRRGRPARARGRGRTPRPRAPTPGRARSGLAPRVPRKRHRAARAAASVRDAEAGVSDGGS